MSGFRLTNGTTTITLHDPSIGVYGQVNYKPATPEPEMVEVSDVLRDGGEVPVTTYRNVVETGTFFLPTAEATIGAINQMIRGAVNWHRRRVGQRAWVEYRTLDTGTWWRSELFHAEPVLADGSLGVGRLPQGRAEIDLHMHRRFYWEGSESYLTLQNNNGTATTLTVRNGNDATYNNYVTITSTIDGDLEAPCRIEYTNNYASGTRTANLWLGHAAYRQPTPLLLALEPTSADGFTTFIQDTVTSGGTYNDGSMRTWTWAYAGVAQLGYWDLPSSLLSAAQGAWFRPIARIPTLPANTYLRLTLKIGNLSPLWASQWVKLPSSGLLHELPAIPLPPYLTGLGAAMNSLTLGLEARSNSAASKTLALDVVHLLPTESFRLLRQQGYGLAQSTRLVDDQISGALYSDGWSGGAMGNYTAQGAPIMLVPGQTNRVYLLVDTNASGAEIDRSGSLRIAYRPRRLVI